ncbi:grasp-with-spasm system ATP-grasp peptide maturase [Aquimarina algiphila]|uniref:Grasp-with-spasm system ATP-grasp peptide maturase n=1 Tax=Aquimarina algiphila TaxID=2047982 RepID=A0A554VN01_9FLAO|nr:grasp-with-spasm system ATP-grasp peptide maturase [Aquimarina algiphila]TSE09736.1 grasp-with-spasm system ATP-grasp peptide maturase [Aquimarina algiphila]
MHLIFSEHLDFSVNRVIDWLSYYNQQYDKYIGHSTVDDHFAFNDKMITMSFGGTDKKESFIVKNDNQEIDFDSIWFRRPSSDISPFLLDFEHKATYPKDFLEYTIQKRIKVFWDFLGYKLKEKLHQGSFNTTGLNKPIVLQEAQNLGLTIPKTLLTNDKEELKKFFEQCNKKIITKSIDGLIPQHKEKITDNNKHLLAYQLTTLIDNIENTPATFAPSLFQECIDKEYEIRTIFLNGTLYSACIFSQLNEQTKIDMRNRDANHPTRYIPYQLDNKIETSIIKLMNTLNLDYGAIDIIKGLDGHYYFLEINPVGQYGDVSLQCNYYLNKKIAEHLINVQP